MLLLDIQLVLSVLFTISGTIAIWFYIFQKDVLKRRITLQAMLWLVSAIAIGLKLGLWLIDLVNPRFGAD